MKIRTQAGVLVLGAVLSLSAYAANRPSGYKTICNEGKTCSVQTTTNVAFGRADKFFYRALTGSFVCNEATFGARVEGGVNECSVPIAPPPNVATGSSCVSTGTVVLEATVDVPAGTTYDGGCKTFIPGPYLENDGSQREDTRSPVFRLQPGASLKNVIIGGQGALGIWAQVTGGSVTHIDNVKWQPQGGYAVRIVGTATAGAPLPVVNITNSDTTAVYGQRIFLANTPATVKADNFIARASGNYAPYVYVFVQNPIVLGETRFMCTRCDIANVAGVFRTESATSTALLKDSLLAPGVQACKGYAPNNCQTSNVMVR